MHKRQYQKIMISHVQEVVKVGDRVKYMPHKSGFTMKEGIVLRLFYSLVPFVDATRDPIKEKWVSIRVTVDRKAPRAAPYDAEFKLGGWRVVGGRSFDRFVESLEV